MLRFCDLGTPPERYRVKKHLGQKSGLEQRNEMETKQWKETVVFYKWKRNET